jgi:hypothetical protein
METSILVAIIAAAASAITFFLTKMKEREAEWRKLRVEQYRELITAMSEVAGVATDEGRRRLALAANHVGLFASPNVLRHLTKLLDAVAAGNMQHHDEILTSLMHAIRSDLDVPGAESQTDIRFKLWAAGGRNRAL